MIRLEPISHPTHGRQYREALPALQKDEAMAGVVMAVGRSVDNQIVYRSGWNEKKQECSWNFMYMEPWK